MKNIVQFFVAAFAILVILAAAVWWKMPSSADWEELEAEQERQQLERQYREGY